MFFRLVSKALALLFLLMRGRYMRFTLVVLSQTLLLVSVIDVLEIIWTVNTQTDFIVLGRRFDVGACLGSVLGFGTSERS